MGNLIAVRERSPGWNAVWIFGVALIVRGGLIVVQADRLRADPDAYAVLAETLAGTGTLGLPQPDGTVRATAFRPPLYPWTLSWFVDSRGRLSLPAVGALHAVLGAATVVLTWDIARRWMVRWPAMIAAGLVLVDPILLTQSALVMTETMAAFLTVLIWWWWIWPGPSSRLDSPAQYLVWSIGLSVLLTLAILCRPTFAVWAAGLLVGVVMRRSVCPRRRLLMLVVIVAIMGGGIGAWTLRNLSAVGRPVWATTHGGYTLLLANNESLYQHIQSDAPESPIWKFWNRRPWDPEPFFREYETRHDDASGRSISEVDDDDAAGERAKALIKSAPMTFVRSCFVRLAWLWHPFPFQTGDRSPIAIVVVGIYYTLVGVAALVALVRHHRWFGQPPWWPAIAMVLALSAVHAVYWSNARMRSPATAMIAIAAAAVWNPRQKLDEIS